MDKFCIKGGAVLSGEVEVSGAKNAVLPAMALALLTPGKFELANVPSLTDIKNMAHLLRIIGARVDYEDNSLMIDSRFCSYYEAPYEIVNKMRASIYVLSPLLVRFKKAKVSLPGGCAIGSRPIDLHLEALKQMGVTIYIENGYINATVDKLKGADINFHTSSVGATVTVLMAAVVAEGTTTIVNAALEPEITYIIEFLQAMGAEITGKGTTELTVKGVKELQPVNSYVIPDRIEAGTFVIAGAITGGDLTVKKCVPHHLQSLIEKLEQAGCSIETGEDYIRVVRKGKIKPVSITTKPYPGFPTDLQAQFLALMSVADGDCVIEETIYPERFQHVAELNRMGAKIIRSDNTALITGVPELSAAPVMASDLRASAALVIAGLVAKGETIIDRVYFLDRGYEKMERKLESLGVEIKRKA